MDAPVVVTNENTPKPDLTPIYKEVPAPVTAFSAFLSKLTVVAAGCDFCRKRFEHALKFYETPFGVHQLCEECASK